MKIGNTTLIPQNVAPQNAQKVVICNSDGDIVCKCALGNLTMPNVGTKKYSVGLLSDTHTFETEYSSNTERINDSQTDLARAISYFSEIAEITCVCGDLGEYNQALGKHKEIVDANKGEMEVLEIAGNHEHYSYPEGVESIITDDEIQEYTGYPLQYTVERNGDVFIMCGAVRWSPMFSSDSIQWLYETLEANRNKRCFLFFHAPIDDTTHCGDALNVITWDGIGTYKTVFISLLKHYKNVIWFHGHTHAMLEMQDYLQGLDNPLPANYDFTDGIHSIHIPSLSLSRDISSGSRVDVVSTSQGYLMEVYENHIVLRGRDFVKGEFIPIAQYCLDTTLQTIEANTFTDSTGIIMT